MALIRFTVLLILALSSCSPMQHTRGNFLDLDDLKKITLKKTTKHQLRALLGPPSSKELFGRDAWYYIGDKMENKSFFTPKITERMLLVVLFGKDSTVQSYTLKDLESGEEIVLKEGAIPTKGRDPSLVSELFGNIGRYSAPKRTAVNKF